MTNARRTRRLLIVPTLAATCAFAFAQQPPPATQKGLDALNDDALIAELANRQLTPLLDRYFEQHQVPEPQRAAIRATLDALHTLNSTPPPSNRDRESAVAAVNANIDAVTQTIHDPRFFLQLATTLINSAVERDANTLEFWGPSAALQLSLRPTVQTVLKALDKANAEAVKERDTIAAAIAPGNQDALAPRYTKYDNYAETAEYNRHMCEYYLALTYDPAAPERQQIAKTALDYLQQFDNPDSQVQPTVRLRLAKLDLVSGDYPAAQKLFTSLADNPGDQIKPPPDLSQQFQGRFFAAVAEMLDNHLDDAAQRLASLRQWIDRIPATNAAAKNGASAAASILDYRLLMARAQAAAPADRRPILDQARAALDKLLAERPDLKPVVYAQVISTLPDEIDVAQLDPVVLAALVRQGEQELQKPADEKLDTRAVDRAIAAADQLVQRRGKAGVSDDLADSAHAVQGFLLDRTGKKVEAANTLLDYLATKPKDQSTATAALDAVLAILDQLRKTNPYDDTTSAIYQRALPVAIAKPFNRRDLAYDFARTLHRQGHYPDAVHYYRQVPADDKHLPYAHFYELLALKQQLDADRGDLPGSLRGQMVADIRRLADEVTAAATGAADNPNLTPDQKADLSALAPKTVLAVADTALHHEHNPRRALQILQDFDTRFKNTPGHAQRLPDALLIRVSAYMDLGDANQATAELVKLLSTQSGGAGANYIYSLLLKLDADLDAARRAGDTRRMQALARSRAALSGYFVDWTAKNPNPDIRQYAYRYRVFDAGTHQLAAELETDPAAKTAAFKAALDRYNALLSPEAHKEYAATLSPDADPSAPDPTVLLGVAACHFGLGDYAAAQPILAQLLNARRLGPPQLPGPDGPTDNDAYWQATYQLLRSNYELAKPNPTTAPSLDPTKSLLKRLYIEFGPTLGGPKWSPLFDSLRQQLLPDFTPPTTAPAS